MRIPDVLLQLIAQYLHLKDRIAFMSCNRATLHACSVAVAWKHVDARLVVRFSPNEAPMARVFRTGADSSWIGHPDSKLTYIAPDERRHFLCEMPEILPFSHDDAEPFKLLCIDSHGTILPDFQTPVHQLLPVEIWCGEFERIDGVEYIQRLNRLLLIRLAQRVCAFAIDSKRGDPRYQIQNSSMFEAARRDARDAKHTVRFLQDVASYAMPICNISFRCRSVNIEMATAFASILQAHSSTIKYVSIASLDFATRGKSSRITNGNVDELSNRLSDVLATIPYLRSLDASRSIYATRIAMRVLETSLSLECVILEEKTLYEQDWSNRMAAIMKRGVLRELYLPHFRLQYDDDANTRFTDIINHIAIEMDNAHSQLHTIHIPGTTCVAFIKAFQNLSSAIRRARIRLQVDIPVDSSIFLLNETDEKEAIGLYSPSHLR